MLRFELEEPSRAFVCCFHDKYGRFQSILRECQYRHDHPLLAISFKNSIEREAQFPHGAYIEARCRHFGLYKLKGERELHCENGVWTPSFP